MNQLNKAKQIAIKAHKGQKRKNGEDYINHPRRVSSLAKTVTGKIAGWLHDIVEDTNITLEDLRREGFDDQVIEVVDAVTRRKGEEYIDFILRIRPNLLARDVKLADLADNLSDLKPGNMRDKYLMAQRLLTLDKLP